MAPEGRTRTAYDDDTSVTSTCDQNFIEFEIADESLCRARLDMHPRRLAVVDEGQVVLDVAVRAEDQRLRRDSGRQRLDVLRRQRVEPG